MDSEKDSLLKDFEDELPNNPNFIKKCGVLATEMQNGIFSLLQLVQRLEILLTSSASTDREKGMLILSQVLENLSNDFIGSEQLSFICPFYADRLNEHHQVVPAVLKGISVLVQNKNLPDGAIKQIMTSLFQNVPCQQQQQADRFTIYKIMKNALDNRQTEILAMNYDFVYGVISAVDGERDPRNLLYLFNWLPRFLKTVTLGHLTEEMFDILACYFPVDFRAPPQDPDSISRETLAESLCKCLTAIPEFAEYCLLLGLEKLGSALRIAKLDSMNLLIDGCKTFDATSFLEHFSDIWSQLNREVVHCGVDQELESLSLRCLESVLNKLSENSADVYKPLLTDIIDTLKGNLLPSLKLFTPSTKLLYYTAKSSAAAADYVIAEIVPILINTFNITTTPDEQVLLFRSLIDLTEVYIYAHGNYDITDVKELSSVPNLCMRAILQEEDKMKAVGFLSLAKLSKSLSSDMRNCLYECFCKCLVTPLSKPLHGAVIECFRNFAENFSSEIQHNVLNNIKINNQESLSLYLNSLVVIADNPNFIDSVLTTITDYCLRDIETVEIATGTLMRLLEAYDNPEIHRILIEKRKIIQQLFDWLKNHINAVDVSKHRALIENMANIFKILIGNQTSGVQSTIVGSTLEDIVMLYENSHNLTVIVILEALLVRIRNDVIVTRDITDFLLHCCIASNDKYIQQISLQLLANILNKDNDEVRLKNRLLKIENICNEAFNNMNHINRVNAIYLMSWVTKALVIRAHSESNSWTAKLLELLDTDEEVAKGFKIIMCDSYDCLSKSSYSNKRLLYQQKFFVYVSNHLAKRYNGENYNYLLAMGYLLQEVPKQVFILQFNKILRLVIMCLEQCHDAAVLCAILEALYDLIETKEPLMEEHLQEFLPRFLKLATFESCMQVRIKALKCIHSYGIGFTLHKLLLHKQLVVFSLARCLDDKKRLVRKEAVEARNCWLMVDAPI